MKFVVILFLSLSALFCSAGHGLAAPAQCASLDGQFTEGDLVTLVLSVIDDGSVSATIDIIPESTHCATLLPSADLDVSSFQIVPSRFRWVSQDPLRGHVSGPALRPPSAAA